MATSTFNARLAGGVVRTPKSSWLNRLAQTFIDQRVAKARRITADHLSIYTDEQLRRFGWSDQDIKRMRGTA